MSRSRPAFRLVVVAVIAVFAASCTGTDGNEAQFGDGTTEADENGLVDASGPPDVAAPQFVLDVRAAIRAVELELGAPQEFFEVTSNAQFTNVFVAVDAGTAAVAFAYVDGELQPPTPKQTGATGKTFVAADVDFDDDRIMSGVAADLPESVIDAISVYGDGFGATYVLAATSNAGGFLDIVVGPQGAIFSVDPV